MRNKAQNFAFVVVILAVTIILVVYKNVYNSTGHTALVAAQEVNIKISLSNDGTYNIADGLVPVTLVVENGTIRFTDSQCPDHVCEGFGKLSNEGDQAICAPARVVVTIE